METLITYGGCPRQRVTTIRQYSACDPGTRSSRPWTLDLQLWPKRRCVILKFNGDMSWAYQKPGRCQWFVLRVFLEAWKKNWWANGWAPGTASVSTPPSQYRNWPYFKFHGFDPGLLGLNHVDWDHLLDMGRKLATTKFLPPVLDWWGENMPEPWSLFLTDPLGMCRALCPYPIGGYDEAFGTDQANGQGICGE